MLPFSACNHHDQQNTSYYNQPLQQIVDEGNNYQRIMYKWLEGKSHTKVPDIHQAGIS